MVSSSHNQVLAAFNNMKLTDNKTSYSVNPLSFLGKIINSIKNTAENDSFSELEKARMHLENVIDKYPNAAHNKKIPYLQLEYKNAKARYNKALELSRK